ncbi:hypothetical protein, partial [Pseudoalteromonas undina]
DFETNYNQAKEQHDSAQAKLLQHQTQHAVLITEHAQHSQAIQRAQAKQLEIKPTMQGARTELNELTAQ